MLELQVQYSDLRVHHRIMAATLKSAETWDKRLALYAESVSARSYVSTTAVTERLAEPAPSLVFATAATSTGALDSCWADQCPVLSAALIRTCSSGSSGCSEIRCPRNFAWRGLATPPPDACWCALLRPLRGLR